MESKNSLKAKPYILYGAGGHARVVDDILQASGNKVSRVWDDFPSSEFCGHGVETPPKILDATIIDSNLFLISIGDNQIRARIAGKMSSMGVKFGTALHPSAILGNHVTVGEGTVIMPGTVINHGAKIGQHCIINTGSTIDHDCVLGDFCHLAPGCSLCGGVEVGNYSFLCVGCKVAPYLRIGDFVTVGGGSMVLHHLKTPGTAWGCPARYISSLQQHD